MEYEEQQSQAANEFRKQIWSLENWHRRPALVSKKGSEIRLFVGQQYDTALFSLVPNGWHHDHCQFCWITISDFEADGTISKAYTNGTQWICPQCYDSIIINNHMPAG